MEMSLYQFESLRKVKKLDRPNIRISPQSMFKDFSWDLSSFEKNPNVKASFSVLHFDFDLRDGSSFAESRYDTLREGFKVLIYSMASTSEGKMPSVATLKSRYTDLRFFLYWLVERNIYSMSDVTPEDTNQFIIEVARHEVHPTTKIGRVRALQYFWKHRKDLTRPISFDPLNGKSAQAVSGVTKDDQKAQRYDFIPDDLAQKLVRTCVNFIREHGVAVAIAAQARDTANLEQIRQGKSKANRDRAKRAALAGTGYNNTEVTTLSRQLLAACYVVINFFTGVRASEMLSMGPDQIRTENGITWVLGRQHKIEKKRKKWMAPDVVFEAHHLAKSLTHPMREAIDYEIEKAVDIEAKNKLVSLRGELFIAWSSKRKYGYNFAHAPQVANIKGSVHSSLKELVKVFDIVDGEEEPWRLHPHQFRKSFVRFMCSNAMNIRYLQEHMGHKSLDMTAWYDSDDFELTGEILKQMKEFKSEKLGAIFNQNQRIAGAGAQSLLNERDDYFVGIATDRAKEAFVEDMADDISLRGTGHSWCMGDSSNGNCTGVVGCMMDVGMTQQCGSALITEEHLPAWLDLKKRNQTLLESEEIGRFQKEAIERVIKETIDPTINALRGGSSNGSI
jgi:integrase